MSDPDSKEEEGDWFLYSGNIEIEWDLKFIDLVAKEAQSSMVTLVLCTRGGLPDAAYRIGRYLQTRYKSVKVLIAGICKSAGTLLAIAADEIIFSPYGELGPLDVQLPKKDDILGRQSGLDIGQALVALEERARKTFHTLVAEVMANSGGVMSFQTASESAARVLSALYGPIFARFDPSDIGSRIRAMRIAEFYGVMLDQKFGNLKKDALTTLVHGFPSHAFVIDISIAKNLFSSTREAVRLEKQLVDSIGSYCRFPHNESPIIKNLTKDYRKIPDQGTSHGAETKPHENPRKTTGTRGKDDGTDTQGDA